MKARNPIVGLMIALSFVFGTLSGCDDGDKQAATPYSAYDCYAYGTCPNQFGPNAFGQHNPNFHPYGTQVPYGQNGFSGCGPYQYPIYYPGYGYACAHQQAFNVGTHYGAWNYQPTSNEFINAHGMNFPNYYSYNNSYAFQGCTFGNTYGGVNTANTNIGYQNNCVCQNLYGVPSQFGVCGYGYN